MERTASRDDIAADACFDRSAQEKECPLLFVGNDFSRTDVRSALQG